MPFPPLLLALLALAVPVAELTVLVAVAGRVGVLTTVALVVLMSALGAALARREGLATMRRLRLALDAGRPPVVEVFNGACVLIAGALLVFPGFISDVAGALLLLPPVRSVLYKALARRAQIHATVARGRPRPAGGRATPESPVEDVIEGRFEEIEPPSDRNRPAGGPDGR